MPIVYLPPTPPGRPGVGLPPRPPDYTTRITWTSSAGRVTTLTDWRDGYTLLDGARGLGMPEYEFYRRVSGVLDGDQVAGVRALSREIFLPIRVHGRDRGDIIDRRRRLAADLDPMDVNGGGRGVLTVKEFDGTSRRIVAHYEAGAEGEMARDVEGLLWATFGLTFRAEQPFWELDPVEIIYRGPANDGRSWLPILPLQVRESAAIGPGMGIRVAGSVRTWPVWTLKGPIAPGARLENVTTGKWMEITAPLESGDELVIDTRPRRKSVRLNGDRAYQHLAHPGSTLWPLPPGANTVDVTASGLAEESRLILRYTPLAPTA
ncbi:phage tail domain-containing protein [Nocardiopsis sp. FR26]|uniref:phage distal tail protein n=1 Tax=Nocardiopsis sp. FR26 TaxID=2605987 RepID=UPI00135CCC3F|nr:phage tail domain-containing protein [Nocardiopsis sp. FR26]